MEFRKHKQNTQIWECYNNTHYKCLKQVQRIFFSNICYRLMEASSIITVISEHVIDKHFSQGFP